MMSIGPVHTLQKKLLSTLVTIAAGLALVALPAFADPPADKADKAVAMVKKAVQYCKTSGRDTAMIAFNNQKGDFVEGELYIFAYDFSGKNLAHGAKAEAIGKNYLDLKDPDGKYIIKEMIEVVKSKGSGWVDYKYKNPVSGAVEQKSSYVEKIGDYFVGCGIYKAKQI